MLLDLKQPWVVLNANAIRALVAKLKINKRCASMLVKATEKLEKLAQSMLYKS